jgi:NNP family nitrate/nitrite transporter-like MFS transporter
MLMGLVSGWVSDRLGVKATITASLLLSGCAVVCIGLLPGAGAIAMIVLQPVMTICFFPPAFVVLSRIVPPSSRNLSVSLAVFFATDGCGFLAVLRGPSR